MGTQSPTYCPRPWHSLSIEPNGLGRVCCIARDTLATKSGEDWNVQKHSLDEAVHSPSLVELRRSLSAGEKPGACQECWQAEEAGGQSLRKTSLKTFETQSADQPELAHLDVKLGNRCNLKCVTCGPSHSSAWYRDLVSLTHSGEFHLGGRIYHLQKTEKGVTPNTRDFDWAQGDLFWETLQELAREKTSFWITFQGGEPLLNPRHDLFLQHCVDQGLSQNLRLHYVTNLTHLKPTVLEQWKSFQAIKVGVSIDGVGPANDYLRYPSRFASVEKNVFQLAQSGLEFYFQPAISWANVFNVPELFRWSLTQSNAWKTPFILSPHLVYYPNHLNIQVLPDPIRSRAIQGLEQVIEELEENVGTETPWWDSFLSLKYQDLGRRIIRELSVPQTQEQRQLFIQSFNYLRGLDRLRGTSLRAALPELGALIDQREFVPPRVAVVHPAEKLHDKVHHP